ncbi:MAG: hypothetical protein HW395_1143, partial [candidate division NC10 bacterium]|nr:hypothetical protein [candidate division NC10 bacterium]
DTSTIIDVAQSRPLPGFNGVHVAGWGSEFPAWKRSSEPVNQGSMAPHVALTVKRLRSTLIPPPRESGALLADCLGALSQEACSLCLGVHDSTTEQRMGKHAILSHHAHPR